MSKEENGGSAFPHHHNMAVMTDNGTLKTFGEEGLTIRDWFAGKALQGMCCNGFLPCHEAGESCDFSPVGYSKNAYDMADAMLQARKK